MKSSSATNTKWESQAALPFDDALGDEPIEVRHDGGFISRRRIQLDENSWIDHVPRWLTGDRQLMQGLMVEAEWEQRSRWMFTRTVAEPRLTAEYSALEQAPNAVIQGIAETLSVEYRRRFTRLWMNWYRDNADSTGWHADRPANKHAEAVIPVLSLGATRRFLVKPSAGGRSTTVIVRGGDLVVMGGRCQRDYHHAVPKEREVGGPRVSLNFSTGQAYVRAAEHDAVELSSLR